MRTQLVIESLLHKINNYDHLRLALKACSVIDNVDRAWNAKENPEISRLVEKFETPHIICLVSKIISVFIIEPKKYNRVHPVIHINGHFTKIRNLSKTKLLSECLKYSNIEDFLPESMCNQIIWIPYEDKKVEFKNSVLLEEEILSSVNKNKTISNNTLNMVIFTEISKNVWTINPNIFNINVTQKTRTTKTKILQHLLKEI